MNRPIKFLLILLLTGILSNVGFLMFAVYPKKKGINQKEIDYRTFRRSLVGVKNKLSSEKELQDKFTKINRDIAKFNLLLPRQEEVTKLIQELPRMAEKAGVKISGVRYQPFVKEENYTRLSFSLPVEGEYSNIRKFIYEIETIRKIIRIERLVLKAAYHGEEKVSIQLTMSTYFM